MVKKISKRIDLTEDGLFSSSDFDPFYINPLKIKKETLATPWWLKGGGRGTYTSELDLFLSNKMKEESFYWESKEQMDKFNLNDTERHNCHLCGRRLSLWKYDLCDKCNKELDSIRQNAERL